MSEICSLKVSTGIDGAGAVGFPDGDVRERGAGV